MQATIKKVLLKKNDITVQIFTYFPITEGFDWVRYAGKLKGGRIIISYNLIITLYILNISEEAYINMKV